MNLLPITEPLRRMQDYREYIAALSECIFRIRLESTVKLDLELMDPLLLKVLGTEKLPVSQVLIHSVAYRLQTHGSNEKVHSSCTFVLPTSWSFRICFGHICAMFFLA